MFPVIDLANESDDVLFDSVESYSLDPDSNIAEDNNNSLKRRNFQRRISTIKKK